MIEHSAIIASIEVAAPMLAFEKCSTSANVPPRRSPITGPRATGSSSDMIEAILITLCKKKPGLRPGVFVTRGTFADRCNND
jgi:hypothetical protein